MMGPSYALDVPDAAPSPRPAGQTPYRVWIRSDYLLWFVSGGGPRFPLVTTDTKPGTTLAGSLASPTSAPLVGSSGFDYRSFSGLRLALDNLRKRKRRAHYEAQATAPGATPRPDDVFEQLEQQVRVRQVLSNLKPEQATLLVLRSEGHSLNEMASILALNPSSVGTLLARADMAFRKEYVNRYGER